MTELTQEHFDKSILKLLETAATKIETNAQFAAIQQALDSHTTTLDGISKHLIDINTDRAALVARLERYDRFMTVVAAKLNIDLKEFIQ